MSLRLRLCASPLLFVNCILVGLAWSQIWKWCHEAAGVKLLRAGFEHHLVCWGGRFPKNKRVSFIPIRDRDRPNADSVVRSRQIVGGSKQKLSRLQQNLFWHVHRQSLKTSVSLEELHSGETTCSHGIPVRDPNAFPSRRMRKRYPSRSLDAYLLLVLSVLLLPFERLSARRTIIRNFMCCHLATFGSHLQHQVICMYLWHVWNNKRQQISLCFVSWLKCIATRSHFVLLLG